jgi:transcriptional regulator GlxA family with amidase domain
MSERRNVAIYVHDDVEVLDFCGPFEVFGAAETGQGESAFRVFTVAKTAAPITTNNGMKIIPNYDFSDCPRLDILLIPGGRTGVILNDPEAMKWIKQQTEQIDYSLSVCTGALVLGKLGLLDGLSSTTHYSAYDRLQAIAPKTTVRRGARYVDNGRIITSAGVSAGLDMALHVVSKLVSEESALATARYMEYDWRRVPEPST